MTTIGYHFTSDTLRDGIPIPPIDEWLEYSGDVVPCKSGLHASPDPWDALQYAPGAILHKVELDGTILPHGNPIDKWAASRRKIIASVDLTYVCRSFAREQARSVLHLWDAPEIVKEYLETGDESKRDAARAAAGAAAWDAARAAWTAAGDAAWGAARAAWTAARKRFNELALEALGQ